MKRMKMYQGSEALVLQENSGWLRYVLWGAAIGMSFLVAGAVNAPVRDFGKIIASMMGVLLFGFSGFMLQIRHIVVDPLRREVFITSKRFRRETTQRIKFEEIRKVLVLMTFDAVENLRGVEVLRERWYIAFALEAGTVPVTQNPYLTKEQASRDGRRIQKLLCVELSDRAEESIACLAQSGKKAAAVVLATRALGMSTGQAKDFVEQSVRSSPPQGNK